MSSANADFYSTIQVIIPGGWQTNSALDNLQLFGKRQETT